MIKPITPAEAVNHQDSRIPDFVIETVNELIKNKMVRGTCTFTQDDIINAICASKNLPDIPRPTGTDVNYDHIRGAIFSNHWLDFEKMYRDAGWKVTYDKPHYSESIQTCWFTFIAPNKQ